MDGMGVPAVGPWTIKCVRVEIAERAVAAGHHRTGPWIAKAIDAYLAAGLEPSRDPAEKAASVKSWTVKGVPKTSRMALVNAAKRSGMNVAEWVAAAIDYKLGNIEMSQASLDVETPKHAQNLLRLLNMCDDLLRLAADIRGECKQNLAKTGDVR